MTLLFDTSAVVSLVERSSEHAAELIRDDGDRPFVSFVTIAELYVGVTMSPDEPTRAARQRTIRHTLLFRQLHLDDPILGPYAQARQLGLRGNDAWIAAAARQVRATLVTGDELFAKRAGAMLDVCVLRR